MKYLVLFFALGSVWFYSCKNASSESEQEIILGREINSAVLNDIEDEIVTASISNNKGEELDMMFNNSDNTASFVFKGETIKLKQDTMASGIKYSNSQYKYTEHQGRIVLRKNGMVVFEHQE